jgi:hypothetical protein
MPMQNGISRGDRRTRKASVVGFFMVTFLEETGFCIKKVANNDRMQNVTAHQSEFAISFSPLRVKNKIVLGAMNPIDPQILIFWYSRPFSPRSLSCWL